MFLFAAHMQPVLSFSDVKQDWHNYVLTFVRDDLPRLVVILAEAFVLSRIVNFFVNRIKRFAETQEANQKRASELRTVAGILRTTAYAVIAFIALLHILPIFKIELAPLLASAGVVGLGIGLGAQSLFKDILNGVFILVDNQFNVGDSVKIASLTGTVEDLTLRRTILRDSEGTLHIVPNSQITTVANYSRDFAIAALTLTVDASANPDRVLAILRETALAVRNDPAFKDAAVADPSIPGIDSIAGRAVTYPIAMRVAISQKDAVLRELRRRILQAFEQNAIPLGTDPANLLLPHTDPTKS
jgi:small conductance mechanosensitive channel